jgi:hypothetical protein
VVKFFDLDLESVEGPWNSRIEVEGIDAPEPVQGGVQAVFHRFLVAHVSRHHQARDR